MHLLLAAVVHGDISIPLLLLKLSALVGVLFPLAAAFIKQDHWSKRTNTWVCVILAVVAALVTTAAQGKVNVHDVIGSFIAIYTVATAFYHGLYQPSGIEPALQSATSLPPGGTGAPGNP